ncbi:MAG TPA: histidine kinase dimerization/phospho-acceptor domain-containing protein [Catenuloplanes sp.]
MTRPQGQRVSLSPHATDDTEADNARHVAAFAARKARFLSVVSHELRTPLASIASFTDSLSSDELAPSERPLALAAVQRGTARMLTLVEDLMLISRLETGDLSLALTAVEVPTLVREAADELTAAEPGAVVEVDVATGPAVRGDAGLLRQLVYVLAGVVIGHAADRRAQLSAEPTADGWTITALGRQAEALTEEHLLASTLALAGPPARRRSTALWMLLADVTAERHGGSLTVGFDPAAGATVTARLATRAG